MILYIFSCSSSPFGACLFAFNAYCSSLYTVLLHTSYSRSEVQQFRDEVRNSPEVKFAVHVFAALDNNNFVRFFKLVKRASYLASCLLHGYFNQVRNCFLHETEKTLNLSKVFSLVLCDFGNIMNEKELDKGDQCQLNNSLYSMGLLYYVWCFFVCLFVPHTGVVTAAVKVLDVYNVWKCCMTEQVQTEVCVVQYLCCF